MRRGYSSPRPTPRSAEGVRIARRTSLPMISTLDIARDDRAPLTARRPVARIGASDEAGGWGLHLVETLAESWGVREGSTHVWFELAQRR